MTRPYSEDLRERVVRVVESGTSRNAAAKQFDVSISFVVKLMQRWKQRGTIKADKYGGWKKSKLAPHGDRIRALVMDNCDITIDELCVLLAAEGIEAKALRNLSTTLRHRRFLFTDSFLLLWKWRVG